MDEDSKELLNAMAGAALAPVTKVVSDLVGIAGGDQLAAFRERLRKQRQAKNAADLGARLQQILDQRGASVDPETPSEHIEEIVNAAADTSPVELKDLFAHLLAAAVDPKRRHMFRRDYIDIVKQMEPLDALVLPLLESRSDLAPHRLGFISRCCERGPDEVYVSFENLHRLGLLEGFQTAASTQAPGLSPKGRQFLSVVT